MQKKRESFHLVNIYQVSKLNRQEMISTGRDVLDPIASTDVVLTEQEQQTGRL